MMGTAGNDLVMRFHPRYFKYCSFYLGWEYLVVGIILFIISDVLIVWAMVQNPFFEPTVRIQKERNQRVISNGPYRIVRHPGYLSGILWHLAMPLIFGKDSGAVDEFE